MTEYMAEDRFFKFLKSKVFITTTVLRATLVNNISCSCCIFWPANRSHRHLHRSMQAERGFVVLVREVLKYSIISSLHCAIDTRYWYQLNLMEKTQCLQQRDKKPTLELHSRAAPSVAAHHHVNGPNTGRNSRGRQIKNIFPT